MLPILLPHPCFLKVDWPTLDLHFCWSIGQEALNSGVFRPLLQLLTYSFSIPFISLQLILTCFHFILSRSLKPLALWLWNLSLLLLPFPLCSQCVRHAFCCWHLDFNSPSSDFTNLSSLSPSCHLGKKLFALASRYAVWPVPGADRGKGDVGYVRGIFVVNFCDGKIIWKSQWRLLLDE